MFSLRSCHILLFALGACAIFSNSACKVGIFQRQISPEIVDELKDFIDLIPAAVVDELVAKHYIIDSNFREVLKYVRSAEFTALLQRTQQILEVVEILDYLHLLIEANKVDEAAAELLTAYNSDHDHDMTCHLPAAEMTKVPEQGQEQKQEDEQLNIVLLNSNDVEQQALRKQSPSPAVTTRPGTRHNLRTFSDFVEELMAHLPRDQYVELINEKRQKSVAFAQFYAALRSAQLRPMVDAALISANLATTLKTLSSHGIDVHSLEGTAFKVISWGPTV